MARKPAAVEQRERDLIGWYKWEFLRRNPEYRKDYANFMREFGAWFLEHGAWYDRTTKYDAKALRFFEETIAPKAKQICERWQISDPCPPEWEFKKSGFHPNHLFTLCVPTYSSQENAGQGWDFSSAFHVDDKGRVSFAKKTVRNPNENHHVITNVY